jgi:hypothetical protein
MVLKEHIEFLSAHIGIRPPASQAETNAAGYMEQRFSEQGLETGGAEFPALRNYAWLYVIGYLLYLFAVMLFPSQPLGALFITVLAMLLFRLDVYLWPKFSYLLAGKRKSRFVVGRKRAYEESRHIIIITTSLDSRKGYAMGAGLRSSILRMEYFSGFLRTLQLVALLAGVVLNLFSMTFWVRICWMLTWPGSLLFLLLFSLELRRWLNGSWLTTVNDNDSSLAVLLGIAERLRERPFQHCDVVLAALGADRDAHLGMHHLLASLEPDWCSATDIINLEAVGGGRLRFLSREGLSRPIPATEDLLDLGQLIAQSLNMELQATDRHTRRTSGAVARSRGYRSLTLMGMDRDGLPSHFSEVRKRSDKLDLIQEEQLENVVTTLLHMIQMIDHQV